MSSHDVDGSTSDADSAVLRARAEALALPRTDARDMGAVHLVAHVGETRVAVPAARSRHVVRPGTIAHLPASGAAILGVASFQGMLAPVADLAALLGVDRTSTVDDGMLIFIDDEAGSWLGLLVDEVDGLLAIDAADMTPDPATGSARPGVIAGFVADGVAVLDTDVVLGDPLTWPVSQVPAASQGER